jgi:hypothetical protein
MPTRLAPQRGSSGSISHPMWTFETRSARANERAALDAAVVLSLYFVAHWRHVSGLERYA